VWQRLGRASLGEEPSGPECSTSEVGLPLFVSIDLILKNLRLGMFLSGRVLRLVEVK
jgi:hypothetical protein